MMINITPKLKKMFADVDPWMLWNKETGLFELDPNAPEKIKQEDAEIKRYYDRFSADWG